MFTRGNLLCINLIYYYYQDCKSSTLISLIIHFAITIFNSYVPVTLFKPTKQANQAKLYFIKNCNNIHIAWKHS